MMSEIFEEEFVELYHKFQKELGGIVLIKDVGEGVKQIYAKKGKEQMQFFVDLSNLEKVADSFADALRSLTRIK